MRALCSRGSITNSAVRSMCARVQTRRNDEAVAIIVPDGPLQMLEVAAAGMGLIAQHHAGLLIVVHRAADAVSE